MKRFLILLPIVTFILSGIFAQNSDKKLYESNKITTAPVINGVLDDEVWKVGEWIDDFTQFEPYNGKKASQKTEFKILFDEDNLYVAIKAFDTSPDSIVNRLTRRDQADGDLAGIIVG